MKRRLWNNKRKVRAAHINIQTATPRDVSLYLKLKVMILLKKTFFHCIFYNGFKFL